MFPFSPCQTLNKLGSARSAYLKRLLFMVPFSPCQTLNKLGSARSAYLKRLYDVAPSMLLASMKPLG